MNPLVVAHIFIFRIIILVLPPRFQGDCHPSSRVIVAVMRFSLRRRPHRFHLPSGLGEARERGQTSVEGRPHHTPRGPGTRKTALATDTALILTRRTGHECSAVTPSDFGRSVMWPPLTVETRTCCKCRGAILPKAVWLSLSSASDNGDGHTAFLRSLTG